MIGFLSMIKPNQLKQTRQNFICTHRYWLLFILILCLSATLRFWHLGSINIPVFDEVYFPLYGYDYLTGKQFFHVHPPLANYIFAAAIWLYYHLPWMNAADLNTLAYDQISVLSYRWINALMGTILCIVAWATTYAISKLKWFAIIVFFFLSIDGSLLVDSRFGTNNIYIVLLGLLAIYFVSSAQDSNTKTRLFLIIAGIFFGLTITVKWNGLGYLLAVLAFGLFFKFIEYSDHFRPAKLADHHHSNDLILNKNPPAWEYLIYLILIPIIVYCLIWITDRLFNTEYGFIEMHHQIFGYHEYSKVAKEHPYCSKWYSWPFLIRPIGYSFSTETITNASGLATTYYKDVHLLPNPILTWGSTIAIIFMSGHWLCLAWQWFSKGLINRKWVILTIILLGYFANLLPWAFVSRCLFLYHYQSAATFGMFAFAWYLYSGFKQKNKFILMASIITLLMITAAFIYWLPIQLGIPLEQSSFYNRMWLQSWI
jgi:dolichyl-phosphate-mannose--protein O-mannosyl transferase